MPFSFNRKDAKLPQRHGAILVSRHPACHADAGSILQRIRKTTCKETLPIVRVTDGYALLFRFCLTAKTPSYRKGRRDLFPFAFILIPSALFLFFFFEFRASPFLPQRRQVAAKATETFFLSPLYLFLPPYSFSFFSNFVLRPFYRQDAKLPQRPQRRFSFRLYTYSFRLIPFPFFEFRASPFLPPRRQVAAKAAETFFLSPLYLFLSPYSFSFFRI
ncbi:MAG: hypothetical protein K9J17_13275, partial [Flavobacteriales bacterium]|nr:hypothetical protein [Flavobacteriales bacterium]